MDILSLKIAEILDVIKTCLRKISNFSYVCGPEPHGKQQANATRPVLCISRDLAAPTRSWRPCTGEALCNRGIGGGNSGRGFGLKCVRRGDWRLRLELGTIGKL